jgi:hypothetical protein
MFESYSPVCAAHLDLLLSMLHYKPVASNNDVLTDFLLLLWWAVSREAPQLPNRLPLLTLLDGVQHTLQNLFAAAQVHGGTGGRAASVLGSLSVATAQQGTNTCGALRLNQLQSCCLVVVLLSQQQQDLMPACILPGVLAGCGKLCVAGSSTLNCCLPLACCRFVAYCTLTQLWLPTHLLVDVIYR